MSAFYEKIALRQSQGPTSACPWVTALISQYVLGSTTISQQRIEQCISDGVSAYEDFCRLTPSEMYEFCGHQSGMKRNEHGVLMPLAADERNQDSGYHTISAAVAHLAKTGKLYLPMNIGNDIYGFKLPVSFPREKIPAPFLDSGFGYHMTLSAGIDYFVNQVGQQPVGRPLCAAMSTSNHLITLAGVLTTEYTVRYYAIDSLENHSTGRTAELAITDLGVGLLAYVSALFNVPNDVCTPQQCQRYTELMDSMMRTHNFNNPLLIYTLTLLQLPSTPTKATVVADGALATVRV